MSDIRKYLNVINEAMVGYEPDQGYVEPDTLDRIPDWMMIDVNKASKYWPQNFRGSMDVANLNYGIDFRKFILATYNNARAANDSRTVNRLAQIYNQTTTDFNLAVDAVSPTEPVGIGNAAEPIFVSPPEAEQIKDIADTGTAIVDFGGDGGPNELTMTDPNNPDNEITVTNLSDEELEMLQNMENQSSAQTPAEEPVQVNPNGSEDETLTQQQRLEAEYQRYLDDIEQDNLAPDEGSIARPDQGRPPRTPPQDSEGFDNGVPDTGSGGRGGSGPTGDAEGFDNGVPDTGSGGSGTKPYSADEPGAGTGTGAGTGPEGGPASGMGSGSAGAGPDSGIGVTDTGDAGDGRGDGTGDTRPDPNDITSQGTTSGDEKIDDPRRDPFEWPRRNTFIDQFGLDDTRVTRPKEKKVKEDTLKEEKSMPTLKEVMRFFNIDEATAQSVLDIVTQQQSQNIQSQIQAAQLFDESVVGADSLYWNELNFTLHTLGYMTRRDKWGNFFASVQNGEIPGITLTGPSMIPEFYKQNPNILKSVVQFNEKLKLLDTETLNNFAKMDNDAPEMVEFMKWLAGQDIANLKSILKNQSQQTTVNENAALLAAASADGVDLGIMAPTPPKTIRKAPLATATKRQPPAGPKAKTKSASAPAQKAAGPQGNPATQGQPQAAAPAQPQAGPQGNPATQGQPQAAAPAQKAAGPQGNPATQGQPQAAAPAQPQAGPQGNPATQGQPQAAAPAQPQTAAPAQKAAPKWEVERVVTNKGTTSNVNVKKNRNKPYVVSQIGGGKMAKIYGSEQRLKKFYPGTVIYQPNTNETRHVNLASYINKL